MKKIKFILLGLVLFSLVNAQEQGRVRVGLDLGLGLPNMGAGFVGSADIRYNVLDNLNVGLRSVSGILVKDMDVNASTATMGVVSSFYGISDYYFHNAGSSFAPFLGGGLGSSKIVNLKIDPDAVTTVPSTITFNSKFGGVLRGGFEAGHFRMALDYYLIPKSEVYDLSNNLLGFTKNSYLNLSIGFYLWGGKWSK
jgi:outer membrane protein X